jgi:hypothetical protein
MQELALQRIVIDNLWITISGMQDVDRVSSNN